MRNDGSPRQGDGFSAHKSPRIAPWGAHALGLRVACSCLALSACGGGGGPGVPDSGPAEIPARAEHVVAFEGQDAFVEALTVPGIDLTGAHIEVEMGSPLVLVDSRCSRARCGVVVRVRDDIPNRGVSVPAPIDTQNVFLVVVEAGGARHRGLVSLNPLDTITGAGATPLTIGSPILLAASAETSAGSVFRGPVGNSPLRWIIFGDAALHGTLDLRAGELPPDATSRAGGLHGGAAGIAGSGMQGGEPAPSGGGAGGGGHVGAGGAGTGADGTPDAGGAGGAADDSAAGGGCLSDFGDFLNCGGAGGGGADVGSGGAAGGGALIVSLGNLDLSGGELLASGEDGVDGGGGGAGGGLLLAGRSFVAASAMNVEGGLGGATATGSAGGDGGRGVLRVDAPGALADEQGPTFDLSAFTALVSARSVTLTGMAAPNSELRVAILEQTTSVDVTAGTDGRFTVDVPLSPGLNRITLVQDASGAALRSWSGTSVQLGRVGASPLALPLGGAVDVVSLPADE